MDEIKFINEKHDTMVKALVKPSHEIYNQLDIVKCDLLHAGLGIFSESGEIADAIKKHIIYNQPLDIENIVEELGDMEFYLAQLRQILFLSRDSILQSNMDKLLKRYPKFTYTDARAKERLDRKELK